MTREQAMQVMVRDQVANPLQGGSYILKERPKGTWSCIWTSPNGLRFRVSRELTRQAWGLGGLE